MDVWTALARRLVEVDLAIENLNGWATTPEDTEELRRLEELRKEIQAALASHHVSRRLRRSLEESGPDHAPTSEGTDPRD
jgi:hypothetical protein